MEWDALFVRIRLLGVFILNEIVDLGFLAAWAMVHYLFNLLMAWCGPLAGLDQPGIRIISQLLSGSLLALVAVYIIVDTCRGIMRIWRAG